MLDSLSDEIARNQSPDLIDEKIASMSYAGNQNGFLLFLCQPVKMAQK